MPIDANIYQNLKPFEMPSVMDSAAKATTLKNLGMQNKKMEREEDLNAYNQKISVVGNALESLAGLPTEQRAVQYPKIRSELIQSGMIDPNNSPDQYDEGWFRQSYNKFRHTKESLDKQKTQAEIENLKRKATGADDPLARQLALLDAREQMAKRKADEEMRRYSKVGGWKLEEGATPTADDAKKFKSGVSAARALLGNMNEYQTLIKNKGSEFAGKDAQRMESLARDIQLAAKNEDLYGLGVLTGPDLQLLEEIIKAPTGLMDQINPIAGSKANNKAQQFREMMNRRINAKASTYGFQPDEEWTQLASGGTRERRGGSPLGGNSAVASDAIRMQAPDGSIRMVPLSQKGEAIAAGGKVLK